MWDESLIESRRGGRGKKRWIGAPLSVAIHGIVVGVMVLSSYWYLEAVPAPPAGKEAWLVPIHVILPKGDSLQAKGRSQKPASVSDAPKTTLVQPTEVKPITEVADTEGPPNTGNNGPEGTGEPSDGQYGVPWGTDVIGTSNAIAEEVTVPISVEMQKPELIRRVEPDYPDLARRLHIQGTVILQAVITRDGTVAELQLLRSVHPLLDRAAINAVTQWLYKPATLYGKPMRVYFTVTVAFQLK